MTYRIMNLLMLCTAVSMFSGCGEQGLLQQAVEQSTARDYQGAIETYNALLKKNQKPLYLNNLAVVKFRNNEPVEALALLNKAKQGAGGSLRRSVENNIMMVQSYQQYKARLCEVIDHANPVARYIDEASMEIDFLHGAEEVGYLYVAKCFERKGEQDKADQAYARIAELFKDAEFDSKYKQPSDI